MSTKKNTQETPKLTITEGMLCKYEALTAAGILSPRVLCEELGISPREVHRVRLKSIFRNAPKLETAKEKKADVRTTAKGHLVVDKTIMEPFLARLNCPASSQPRVVPVPGKNALFIQF